MNKIAPVVFHGIYYDVELFRNVADDGFWDSVFVLFNFGHKFSLSANNLPADSVFFVRNTAQRVKELPLPFILTRFFHLLCPDFLRKIFKTRLALPKLKFAEFPKQDQAELAQESFPFIFPFHGHFGHTVFEQK